MDLAMNFRKTYMFRHQYQYLKGYCYTFNPDSDKSLVGKNIISEKVGDFNISYARYVSPVFLKPHEIMLIHIFHSLSCHQFSEKLIPDVLDIKSIEDKFWNFNYEWRTLFYSEQMENVSQSPKFFKDCFNVTSVDNSNPIIRIIEINDEEAKKNISPDKKIGIVNWKIDSKDLEKCLCGEPNKSNPRREKLFEVLNYAAKKHVEMLVFPETSIPFDWLPLLVDQAIKNNCAVIGGLEYYVSPGMGEINTPQYFEGQNVLNLSFNIFPVKMKRYDDAAIILRKKNYYAPSEQKLISAFHKLEPTMPPIYHLIHWRKSYFSTYNCFELSNISDRSLFKSKVDFIIAIEFNRDTHYFANITEAWTRDLHCFIVQSNSSDYGDTKVVQPTKNINMDIMKIKGGDYPLVMVTTLHIEDLREYHRKDMIGQLDDKSSPFFKPTPACYEWQWAERRINNESPTKDWF